MIRTKILTLLLFTVTLSVLGCNSAQPTKPSTSTQPKQVIKLSFNPGMDVTGVVRFKGALPKLATLDMTQDPACPPGSQPSEAFVIKGDRVANVFVYIKEGLPAGQYGVPTEPVVLDQKGCRYSPHVMGIVAGQPFKVLNSDLAQHNVHPMPANNDQWNESQMPSGQPITKTFDRPEMMVPIQCNQHPWMRAYVSVMPNHYFAVSAADGTFTIKNLPPGEYTIAAVHEKLGEQTMKVKVGEKENVKADFVFSGAQ